MLHHSLALIDLSQTADVQQIEVESRPEPLVKSTPQATGPRDSSGQDTASQDATYDANRAMVASFILILFGAMIGWLSHFVI